MKINEIKNWLFAISLILGMGTIGCPVEPITPSPRVPTDADWCAPGCQHLRTLQGRDGQPGCEESRDLIMPSGDAVSCEMFCRDTLHEGRNLFPSCWTLAKECDDIEKYRQQEKSCFDNTQLLAK